MSLAQIWLRNFPEWHHTLLSFVETIAMTYFVTTFLMWSVGRLRPSWLQACKPGVPFQAGPPYTYYTDDVCTADWSDIRSHQQSFPSGHAATIFGSYTWLMFYLNAKLKVQPIYHIQASIWPISQNQATTWKPKALSTVHFKPPSRISTNGISFFVFLFAFLVLLWSHNSIHSSWLLNLDISFFVLLCLCCFCAIIGFWRKCPRMETYHIFTIVICSLDFLLTCKWRQALLFWYPFLFLTTVARSFATVRALVLLLPLFCCPVVADVLLFWLFCCCCFFVLFD